MSDIKKISEAYLEMKKADTPLNEQVDVAKKIDLLKKEMKKVDTLIDTLLKSAQKWNKDFEGDLLGNKLLGYPKEKFKGFEEELEDLFHFREILQTRMLIQ